MKKYISAILLALVLSFNTGIVSQFGPNKHILN